MNHRKPKQLRASTKNAWAQLALGSDGQPPGGVVANSASQPPRDPTLTEKFNRAANGIVSKQQIALLRRQMSQPRHTYELTPLGSVKKAINHNKDRSLAAKIAELEARLKKHKGIKKEFSKATRKGMAKQSFNRSSQGRGM